MAIELCTTVRRIADALTAPVDDELVILNLVSDHYLALDDVGRRIWDLVAEPRRVADLCQQLSQEFAGPPDQIAADVLAFLDELAAEGVLDVVESQPA